LLDETNGYAAAVVGNCAPEENGSINAQHNVKDKFLKKRRIFEGCRSLLSIHLYISYMIRQRSILPNENKMQL
jgi:hypothetical protein